MTKPNRLLSLLAIPVLPAIMIACSGDDPATPPQTADLQLELISPLAGAIPEAAFVVRAEANAELARVVFLVDNLELASDDTAPFEFLWNVALWADGAYHYLRATGYDPVGRTDSGALSMRIPVGTRGVLLAPQPGAGVLDPAAVSLRWRRDPLAAQYEVALALQPDFAEPTHTTTTNDTTVSVPATAQQWQYWRVRQQTGTADWGPWSEATTFFGGAVFDRDYVYLGANSSWGRAVEPTGDGGYLVAGSFSGVRPLVRRLGPLGESLWTYEPYFRGRYRDLAVTDDGGCVVVGSVDDNVILTRLDADGAEVWSRPYYGSAEADYGYDVHACAAGGFVVAGLRNGVAWLLRVDDSGWINWQQTYDATSATALVEDTAGGFVLTGALNDRNTILLGTDHNGVELWRTELTGEETTWGAPGIDLVADETGYTVLDEDGRVHRFDSAGNYQWTVSLGGWNDFQALDRTGDGGYIVVSDTELICLDESGQELWRHGASGVPYDVRLTADAGFVITGTRRQPSTQSQLWVLKTDAAGTAAPPATK